MKKFICAAVVRSKIIAYFRPNVVSYPSQENNIHHYLNEYPSEPESKLYQTIHLEYRSRLPGTNDKLRTIQRFHPITTSREKCLIPIHIRVKCFLLASRSCRKHKKLQLTISQSLILSTTSCCCCCCCCYREVRAAMPRDILSCALAFPLVSSTAADRRRSPHARYLYH